MSHIYFSNVPTGVGSPTTGHAYIHLDSTDTVIEQTIPGNVNTLDRKPQLLSYRRRIYNVGQFSRLIVRDEANNLRLGGVRSPRTIPGLVDGADTGGSTGNMIGYQTFLARVGGKKVESNPGPPTLTLSAVGTGRAWSNLDVTPEDAHVTHTRGYVSVDGEIPALAWERPLPCPSTYTENVLSTGLGETLPVRIDTNGQPVLNPYARGVPPYTMFAEVYHDAFYYAGDPNYPERIYYSKIYEPEAVNTTPITVYGRTEYPWLSTTDGSPVTGIKRQGDELVVGTLRGIDIIQGYSGSEHTIRRISDYWGVLSHFSMRRCGPLGSLFFAAPQGITIYNSGSFKFVGNSIETWWRDNYRLFPSIFKAAYGAEDRYWRSYKLLLPQFGSSPYSLYIVCDYNAAEMGESVIVSDRRGRNDQCLGELFISNDSEIYELYTGSCDGYVRQENVDENGDDDGDSYQKKFTVTTPHRYVMGQAGDDRHGRTYNSLDLYLKHDVNSTTISMWGGDDDAPSAVSPQWTATSPAGQAATGSRPLVSRTSEHWEPQALSGKGVTLRVEVTSPVGIEYRGWEVDHVPGPQSRPFKA